MDNLQSILQTVLHRRGLHAQAKASALTHLAQEWIRRVLPSLADDLSADQFANATLRIACRHSIAAQECFSHLGAMKEFLQRESGVMIEEIRLVRS